MTILDDAFAHAYNEHPRRSARMLLTAFGIALGAFPERI